HQFMRRAASSTDYGVLLVAALLTGIVAATLPVVWGIAAALALVIAMTTALTLAVGSGVWVGAAQPLGAAGLALFGAVAWQYFVEERSKREIRGLFGRYVSKDVINQ